MGTPSPEETGRNKNLIEDYGSKNFTMVELVSKYQITSSRIYQIVKRAKSKLV